MWCNWYSEKKKGIYDYDPHVYLWSGLKFMWQHIYLWNVMNKCGCASGNISICDFIEKKKYQFVRWTKIVMVMVMGFKVGV